MASSFVNFIVKNFLSNFLEINPYQTNISLLSGELILKNVKVKQKLLEFINIDYLEIINGYIGNLKILLNLPNFYSNPIKIYINDLYIYSKQKKISDIKEKDRIESLISNKLYKLLIDESLIQQINEINDTSDNFVNQIIRNMNIFVKNIVFRFEDDNSNHKNPFSLGLVIKLFKIVSLNELFDDNFNMTDEFNNNSDSKRNSEKNTIDYNNIYISDNPYEISDKKIIVDGIYFYIDSYDDKSELKFEKFIDEKVKVKTSENLENYINEIMDFYYYCQSELNIHSLKKNSHEYIFFDLNLDINLSMNFNLDNNHPQYQIIINDIKNFDIYLKIKQISSIFNLLSYYNLYYFYLIGLNKTIFNLTLNEDEKEKYILDYIDYYYNKYILKNIEYSTSNFIKEKEEKMTYEDIKDLRRISIKNLKLYEKIKEKEKKLNDLNNTWFFFTKNEEEIKKLENEIKSLKNLLREKIINKINNDDNRIILLTEEYNNLEIDENLITDNNPYEYLPDNFILYLFKIEFKSCHIIIYDNISEPLNSNILKGDNKKLIDLTLTELSIKISLGIKFFGFALELFDMYATQEIINSKDYDVILMSQRTNSENLNKIKRKILLLEFESNSNENYTYKIILKNEKKFIFVLNLFELNYILNKIMNAIYSSILFMDLSQYAQENINKYLKLGYLISNEYHNNKSNLQKYNNYYYDIDIISPIIIMPQNILDRNNNKCIIINLGDISLKSNLVEISKRSYLTNPEYNKFNLSENTSNIQNKSFNKEDMYDNYNLAIKGFNVLFSFECLKKDFYNSIGSSFVINNTDINLIYQTLILPSDKNLNNVNLIISINQIEINFDEFQIFLLIVFFKQMKIQSDILYKMNLNQTKLSLKNKKLIETFKEHLIEKGILNDGRNEEIIKEGINNRINSYISEKDFLTKKNEYFYEVKINKIIFKIYKIFPNLENITFLEFHFQSFNFKMCGNSIKDSLMKISVERLKLFDKEKDINQKYKSIKEYQTLIEKKKKNIINNNDMFSYLNIYNDISKENKIELNLNNTSLIVTFDVLTRIYTFSMYYYNIFYENYLNSNTEQKKEIDESNQKENALFKNKIKENCEEINNQVKIESIKKKYTFRINLIENYVLIPYDISSLFCPILSLKINMAYDQSSETETIKRYNKNKNQLIDTIEKPNKNNMNIMIYESDIDLISYDFTNKKFLFKKQAYKILSNYRIQYSNKYLYLSSNKQSLSNIDILIEPIIINMSLEQFKDLLLFYNLLMKFLYENLYEIYIPYIKPENVIYHDHKKYIMKKKNTIKKMFWRVFIMDKIRKSLDKGKVKPKKDFNIVNSLNSINLNMSRATVTIFVNELNSKRLLLELQLSKMIFKSINNNNPKNKTNVSNELLSILSGTKIPLENYIIHQLYKYMDISFIFKLNYYNLEYASFEPIIEPLPFQYLSYQVDKIFRQKTLIKSEDIINFNVSPASIKVLNLFLAKYYSDKNNDLENRGSNLRSSEINYEIQNDINKNEEIILKISNKTGLPIRFWFDFKNQEKYMLNNDESLEFSNGSLYETRRQQMRIQQKYPEKNTFSFQILGYEIIPNININKNNILYFKTNIKDNKYLLYHITIDTSELVNKINICSSIFFINKTKFDQLIIYIDDKHIKNNYIVLKKDKKYSIPLSWMLSKEKIFFQIDKNSIKNILYNNIFECVFCQKLKDDELEKITKEKIDLKEKLSSDLNNNKEINLQHPKYKEYISTYVKNRFNKNNIPEYIKKTTIINKNDKNKSFSFSFNYLAFSNNERLNKINNGVYKKLKNTERSYKYHIIIRPIINIYNYIPFNIIAATSTNRDKKENEKYIIKSLKNIEIYDINWATNKNLLMTLSLNYYKNIFKSNIFALLENINEDIIKQVELKDKQSNSIVTNILIKYSKEEENNPNEIIEQFSLSSIDCIFFFEYIVNNRMEFDIYSKELMTQSNIYKFKGKNINLLSNNKGANTIYLSSNKINFDENVKLILKSIGINNNIELSKNNEKYNISCSIVTSVDFIYSNIIILEPKYILINNLDFEIFYMQLTKDTKRKLYKINKNGKKNLSFSNTDDKLIFKLAIKYNNKFWLSGPFDINESKDFDYKIKINKELYKEFCKNYRKHCFKEGKNYYIFFRIRFKIYQNTTYIFILFSEFPLLEIKNRTSQKIKIYENEYSNPIIVSPRVDIPFIWEDSTKIKEKLICNIMGNYKYFSFSIFEEKKVKINKYKYINLTVKRNQTGSIILILEEKEFKRKLKDYFMKKQVKSLSNMTLDLKGLGLSFIDDTPKEVFYISFYGIKLLKRNDFLSNNSEYIEDMYLYVKNFQIDYCLNDSLKSIIYPKFQIIPALEEQNNNEDKDNIDFISIFVERTSYYNSDKKVQYMNYDKIVLILQEMNLKINQTILMQLLNIINEYTSLLDYNEKIRKNIKEYVKEDNLIENNNKYIEALLKENIDSNKTLINYLILSQMKINITFRIDLSNIEISFLPNFISNILISLGNNLIKISDSPLSFNSKEIRDIYIDMNLIISLLIKQYTTETILQIYKILGSTDLIGNPINLIEKIGNGFSEFVYEPTKGLMQGPTQFGRGLARGFGGLLNGVVGGTMDSVSKITGGLYSTVHGILGKKKDMLNDEDEEDEPRNLIVGAEKGFKSGYQEIKEGFNGLFVNPFQRVKSSGFIGLVKGIGTGIFGLAVSPITFLLKFGGSLAVGTKNTFGYLCNKILKNQRFRFPRYIEDSKPLQKYDEDLSAAKEFLAKYVDLENPIILYFSSFICNNPGYENKDAFLIVTKNLFLVLSNQNEILWNINIKDVEDIELFYKDNNFKILFDIKNKKEKMLIIDKSDAVVTCKFYDLLKDEIKSLPFDN